MSNRIVPEPRQETVAYYRKLFQQAGVRVDDMDAHASGVMMLGGQLLTRFPQINMTGRMV